jgi:FtsH-binding integral membrane protein
LHHRSQSRLGQGTRAARDHAAVRAGAVAGLAVGPVINAYAEANPAALWQAAGATAASVALLGSVGYATRRDLSSWARGLFWALVALIGFGIVAIFISIPHANVIYAVAGLVVFGAYTIFDFSRLRRSASTVRSRSPRAHSSDVFNVFLFFLELFGGRE